MKFIYKYLEAKMYTHACTAQTYDYEKTSDAYKKQIKFYCELYQKLEE